jgi:hypothetical protein
MRTQARFVVAFTSAVMLATPAFASPTPDPSTPQAQYRRAHEAINAKNWEEARKLLLDLWSQAKTYDVGSSLVFVEYQLQHYAEAATYAAFAIQNAPPIERPEEIDRLRKALDELKQRVGTVNVVVNRPGADVLVDATVVGTSPLSTDVYVDVGPHQIEARIPGSVAVSERVDALAGETYRVELTIQPSAGEAALSTEAGSADATRATPEGAPPTTAPARNYTPSIVTASVGGAALIGGVVAFVVSANKRADARNGLNELSGLNPCGDGVDAARAARCNEISEQVDAADTFRIVGFVGVGAALAAGAATYVLWPTTGSQRVGASVMPTVSSNGAGMFATFHGAF